VPVVFRGECDKPPPRVVGLLLRLGGFWWFGVAFPGGKQHGLQQQGRAGREQQTNGEQRVECEQAFHGGVECVYRLAWLSFALFDLVGFIGKSDKTRIIWPSLQAWLCRLFSEKDVINHSLGFSDFPHLLLFLSD